MMTEMQTIEGGQKDVSSLEGTTLKKCVQCDLNNYDVITVTLE